MRLIDLDSDYIQETLYRRGFKTRQGIEEWLNNSPTVDAVQVVRCKDCKHAWIHPCGYVYCHRDGRNAYEMTFNLDSFCSYGERKEGAE